MSKIDSEILYKQTMKFCYEAQIDMMIEKMADLTEVLLKYRRLKYKPHTEVDILDKKQQILANLTNLELMRHQMVEIFDNDVQ